MKVAVIGLGEVTSPDLEPRCPDKNLLGLYVTNVLRIRPAAFDPDLSQDDSQRLPCLTANQGVSPPGQRLWSWGRACSGLLFGYACSVKGARSDGGPHAPPTR